MSASLDQVLKIYRTHLMQMGVRRLSKMVRDRVDWFAAHDVAHSSRRHDELYAESRTDKSAMVKWIMGSDPLVVEGGLLDFLTCAVKDIGFCHECHRLMSANEIGDEDRTSRVCDECACLQVQHAKGEEPGLSIGNKKDWG